MSDLNPDQVCKQALEKEITAIYANLRLRLTIKSSGTLTCFQQSHERPCKSPMINWASRNPQLWGFLVSTSSLRILKSFFFCGFAHIYQFCSSICIYMDRHRCKIFSYANPLWRIHIPVDVRNPQYYGFLTCYQMRPRCSKFGCSINILRCEIFFLHLSCT